MGWRTVVISNTVKLDYKMGYLCIRSKDNLKRIYIDEINVLVIETTNASLTSYLLVELANKNINVIFCDHKRCPHGMYYSLYGSHDTSRAVREQIEWSKEIKAIIWQKIIYEKIKGQSAVLLHNNKETASEKLQSYLPNVELGDASNREGHAAKVYFNSLFGIEFSRERNKDTDFINSSLNYGYSILLSAVAREITSTGYLTQIGIFHDNVFNKLNLASDVMEPFRPFIDQIVIELPDSEFDHNAKMKILEFMNRKIKIDNREQYFSNALSIYVKSVLDSITFCNPKMIKFPEYDMSIYESDSIL